MERLLHTRRSRSKRARQQAGVTMFELLIAVSLLAIISTISVVSWAGYQRTQILDAAGRDILNGLHEAQGNAFARRDGTGTPDPDQWGVRITNVNGGNSTLELFAGSTYAGGTVTRMLNFGGRVELTAPAESNVFDFIYELRSGKLDTGNSTALSATCPNAIDGNACLDIDLYNLADPSATLTVRVWEHGGIETL